MVPRDRHSLRSRSGWCSASVARTKQPTTAAQGGGAREPKRDRAASRTRPARVAWRVPAQVALAEQRVVVAPARVARVAAQAEVVAAFRIRAEPQAAAARRAAAAARATAGLRARAQARAERAVAVLEWEALSRTVVAAPLGKALADQRVAAAE
jgi:hypothetical protein